MSENKSKYIIPAIGAGIVVVGGFAAYNYFIKGPSGDALGALASAKLIPDEALATMYITTEPKAWEKVQKFGTPEAKKLFTKGVDEFNKSTAKDGFSYEKDVQPWIGGITFAVLPPNPTKPAQSKASPKTPEADFLVVIGIKDKIAALNTASKIKSDKSVKSQDTDYKGITITETKNDKQKGQPTYMAFLDNNYVVISSTKRSIEQSIDTLKGEPSLANKEGIKEVLATGGGLDNAVAQIYIPNYGNIIDSAVKSDPSLATFPPQLLEQAKLVKSMAAGIGIDDAGLRMKATVNYDEKLAGQYQAETTESKIVSNFPGDTIALLNGTGINRSWNAILDQSKNFPELQTVVGAARTYTKYANIDLDKEVFGWMDSEFAFAAIPSDKGLLAQTGFGGAMVFDTKDEKTAKSMFSKLDTLVKAQNVTVQERNSGSKKITEWQIPGQGALIAHGWLDQDTVFVALGAPIADAITTQPSKSLSNDESYKAITTSLAKPNAGYFYLDMDKTMTIVNRFATKEQAMDPDAQAILSSIRGLSMTTSNPNKTTSQVEMLLSLK